MLKYILGAIVAMFMLSGCNGLTSYGVAKDLSQERTARYQQGVQAHQTAVTSVMDALSKIDRGGMKIDTTEDGRIKSISYTDKLDMAVIAKALEVPVYKEEKVQSVLSEAGDFVLKATNLAVPFASIYYNSKNHIASQEANVAINSSNNDASKSMWSAYTTGFNKETTVDNTSVATTTNTTNTSVTDTSVTDNTSTNVPNITVDLNSTTVQP